MKVNVIMAYLPFIAPVPKAPAGEMSSGAGLYDPVNDTVLIKY